MTRFVGTPLRGIEFSSPSDEAISARVVSDSVARLRIDAGGRLTWSSGSSTGDVNLYRYDVDILKTDDAFEAAGGLTTITTSGMPSASSPDGTIAVDTTNNVFYFRSGGQWLEVSSGANVVIAETAPLDAESGDLWFNSSTLVLYILNGTSWVSVSGSLTLAALDDVSLSSPAQYDVLTYNGTEWTNAPSFTNGAPIFSQTFGDGSSTEFVLTHGFGTRDVLVAVRNASSPYEVVDVAWAATSDTTITINTSVAPSSNELRATIFAGGGVSGVTSVYGTANEIEVNQTTGSIQVGLPADVTVTGTITVGDIAGIDTDNIDEGTTNLYFTDQRALDATATAYDHIGAAATAETNAKSYADDLITNIIDAAPATLDTLNELAAALGDDANFATTVTNSLATKAPLDSPALTGTPTAPTADPDTNTTQIATTAFVQSEIANFATELDELSDVVITSPQNGQILEFDGTSWVNTTSATDEPIGHEDKTGSYMEFDEITRTFTIQPVATATEYIVWCKGKRFTKTSPETVTLPDVTGLYYIYFDSSGVLSYKTTYFTWDEDTPTAYVYWGKNSQKAHFFADERHGITLDWATHEYLHRTRGAAIANGFGATNYTLVGDGSLDSHAQLDIANGTFFDEDLQVDIVHSASPTPFTWQQVLQPATIPVFYKWLTGEWISDTATAFPLKQGLSLPTYNELVGSDWLTPDAPNNSFIVMWVLATNNLNHPVIAVMGQASYGEKGAAEAAFYETLNLDGFPVVEFRPLYKLIFECKDSYSNTVNARLAGIIDLRSIISGGFGIPTVPVNDHGTMTGLSDDDHPQYVHATDSRTISAVHTFSNGLISSATIETSAITVDGIEIDTTGAVSDQVLRFDGTKFAPGIASTVAALDDLTDVVISSAAVGEVLKFDGTNWVNGVGGGGAGNTAHGEVVGDGTSTQFTITHNLGTRDIVVQCRTYASPYESVEVRWEATTADTVLIEFAQAPSIDEMRVLVYASIGATGPSAYSTTIGDGSSTDYVINHVLNTRDIVVGARSALIPYEVVDINWEATSLNTITVKFQSPISSNSVRVTVYAAGGASGVTQLTGTTNEIEVSDSTGAIQIGLPDDVTITGDLTVSGDLTVNGTATTLNTTTISVDDINITLGDTASPTDTTANGGGVILKGATDKTILWDSATGSWKVSPSAVFTTVAAHGRAIAIAGDASSSNAILQFTNNAVSAQWGSVYATSAGKLVLTSQTDGVGVGGTPSYPFHVQSSDYNIVAFQSSGAETKVNIINTASTGRHYAIISGGSGGAYAGGFFGIYDNTAAANRLSINSSGTVYIPGQVNTSAGGVDGGWMLRPWTANGAFMSLATRDMAGAEYVLITDGTNAFLGSGSGGTTYVRGPANSTTGQLYVNSAEAGSSGHWYAQSTQTWGGTGTNAVYMPYLAMYLNRLWDNYPGIEIVNDTTWGPITEFRIHGYSGPSGGDFGINLRIDGSYLTLSDSRIKTNVTPITNAMSIVSNLNGIRYQRMNRSLEPETHGNVNNGIKFGLIAQDSIPFIPECVSQTENAQALENGWCDEYAMDYSQLTPLLIEAIKELNARIEQLEASS